jgi:hypothetical protein
LTQASRTNRLVICATTETPTCSMQALIMTLTTGGPSQTCTCAKDKWLAGRAPSMLVRGVWYLAL